MTATNVNAKPFLVSPLGGAGLNGLRLVYATGTKAAQNDTLTLSGVKEIIVAYGFITDGTDKATETITSSEAASTVLTLASATTGIVHVIALVK